MPAEVHGPLALAAARYALWCNQTKERPCYVKTEGEACPGRGAHRGRQKTEGTEPSQVAPQYHYSAGRHGRGQHQKHLLQRLWRLGRHLQHSRSAVMQTTVLTNSLVDVIYGSNKSTPNWQH